MKETMKKNAETVGQETVKDFFEKVVILLRENFVTIFERESETTLLIKHMDGRVIRLKAEEVL